MGKRREGEGVGAPHSREARAKLAVDGLDGRAGEGGRVWRPLPAHREAGPPDTPLCHAWVGRRGVEPAAHPQWCHATGVTATVAAKRAAHRGRGCSGALRGPQGGRGVLDRKPERRWRGRADWSQAAAAVRAGWVRTTRGRAWQPRAAAPSSGGYDETVPAGGPSASTLAGSGGVSRGHLGSPCLPLPPPLFTPATCAPKQRFCYVLSVPPPLFSPLTIPLSTFPPTPLSVARSSRQRADLVARPHHSVCPNGTRAICAGSLPPPRPLNRVTRASRVSPYG